MQRDSVKNRQPAVAGSFYPSNPEELIQNLKKMFSIGTPDKNLGKIVALISPHAGYVYSGTVAASAFNQLSDNVVYDNIFLIGSSHHMSFDGASVYNNGDFLTPLGIARVNIELADKLIADSPDVFDGNIDVHTREHSLEVQVPFLQYLYKDRLKIVPIIIATHKPGTIKKIADALSPYFNGTNLFVISTDFSHYPDYQNAIMIDNATSEAIIKNSSKEFAHILELNEGQGIHNLATSICGWTSMMTLLNITEQIKEITFHRIKYTNSGDAPYGDKNRVVGYHAMAVTINNNDLAVKSSNELKLNTDEKSILLHIARVTLKNYLDNGKTISLNTFEISENLKIPAGAFVTLTKNGKLRGCIGHFNSELPLLKVVQDMAISAATNDYRFPKVMPEELNELEIEISVLTPMHKIQSIEEIELGKHGVYVKKGTSTGTFLPQVAKQTGWSREEFLSHCARDKAGIGWDGWRNADIYIYEALVFGEH